jgi:hypothetical protein
MAEAQPDLFASAPQAPPARDPAWVAAIRAQLHATLALVQGAERMPWDDMRTIIHEDNRFRWNKDVLPPDEGAALWAAFDKEMDRLYAIMNAGRDPDAAG